MIGGRENIVVDVFICEGDDRKVYLRIARGMLMSGNKVLVQPRTPHLTYIDTII